MIEIKLTEDQVKLLKSGTVIETEEHTYMYYPFWIRDKDGKYSIIPSGQLPEDLVKKIKGNRE